MVWGWGWVSQRLNLQREEFSVVIIYIICSTAVIYHCSPQ